MKKQEKPYFKLPIQQELAYEVISISIIVILFGVAFLFATNLLSFNWYTVLFVLLSLFVIYLKRSCHLVIADNQLTIRYYKFSKPFQIAMDSIAEMTFHEKKRQVKIKNISGAVTFIYLNMKNKEKLLNYIVQHYPEIDCIFI